MIFFSLFSFLIRTVFSNRKELTDRKEQFTNRKELTDQIKQILKEGAWTEILIDGKRTRVYLVAKNTRIAEQGGGEELWSIHADVTIGKKVNGGFQQENFGKRKYLASLISVHRRHAPALACLYLSAGSEVGVLKREWGKDRKCQLFAEDKEFCDIRCEMGEKNEGVEENLHQVRILIQTLIDEIIDIVISRGQVIIQGDWNDRETEEESESAGKPAETLKHRLLQISGIRVQTAVVMGIRTYRHNEIGTCPDETIVITRLEVKEEILRQNARCNPWTENPVKWDAIRAGVKTAARNVFMYAWMTTNERTKKTAHAVCGIAGSSTLMEEFNEALFPVKETEVKIEPAPVIPPVQMIPREVFVINPERFNVEKWNDEIHINLQKKEFRARDADIVLAEICRKIAREKRQGGFEYKVKERQMPEVVWNRSLGYTWSFDLRLQNFPKRKEKEEPGNLNTILMENMHKRYSEGGKKNREYVQEADFFEYNGKLETEVSTPGIIRELVLERPQKTMEQKGLSRNTQTQGGNTVIFVVTRLREEANTSEVNKKTLPRLLSNLPENFILEPGEREKSLRRVFYSPNSGFYVEENGEFEGIHSLIDLQQGNRISDYSIEMACFTGRELIRSVRNGRSSAEEIRQVLSDEAYMHHLGRAAENECRKIGPEKKTWTIGGQWSIWEARRTIRRLNDTAFYATDHLGMQLQMISLLNNSNLSRVVEAQKKRRAKMIQEEEEMKSRKIVPNNKIHKCRLPPIYNKPPLPLPPPVPPAISRTTVCRPPPSHSRSAGNILPPPPPLLHSTEGRRNVSVTRNILPPPSKKNTAIGGTGMVYSGIRNRDSTEDWGHKEGENSEKRCRVEEKEKQTVKISDDLKTEVVRVIDESVRVNDASLTKPFASMTRH